MLRNGPATPTAGERGRGMFADMGSVEVRCAGTSKRTGRPCRNRVSVVGATCGRCKGAPGATAPAPAALRRSTDAGIEGFEGGPAGGEDPRVDADRLAACGHRCVGYRRSSTLRQGRCWRRVRAPGSYCGKCLGHLLGAYPPWDRWATGVVEHPDWRPGWVRRRWEALPYTARYTTSRTAVSAAGLAAVVGSLWGVAEAVGALF